jgi:hypothetical protein
MLANSYYQDVPFMLPKQAGGREWRLLLDTSESIAQKIWPMKRKFALKGRSVVLLELEEEQAAEDIGKVGTMPSK